jgi:hypothetical protein
MYTILNGLYFFDVWFDLLTFIIRPPDLFFEKFSGRRKPARRAGTAAAAEP